MSNDATAAIRRLINLWIRNRVERGDDYTVQLRDALSLQNIQTVSRLDLLKDHDGAIWWDRYRTRELVRQWLRERPSGRPQ
jgi:hypothetical protein